MHSPSVKVGIQELCTVALLGNALSLLETLPNSNISAYPEVHEAAPPTSTRPNSLTARCLCPKTGRQRRCVFATRRLRSTYETAIREVLLLGGDTDTNAAIVGGIVGALNGASAIPIHMAQAVLGRLGQPNAIGPRRPDWLQSGRLPGLFANLYGRATGSVVDVSRLPGVPGAEDMGGAD